MAVGPIHAQLCCTLHIVRGILAGSGMANVRCSDCRHHESNFEWHGLLESPTKPLFVRMNTYPVQPGCLCFGDCLFTPRPRSEYIHHTTKSLMYPGHKDP